eukprot:2723271-Pleurochrysis_carterae.AAC.2
MELGRSSLVAASAPVAYWDFAVLHAVDVLNRTTTPPSPSQTSFELVTSDNLAILGSCPSVAQP